MKVIFACVHNAGRSRMAEAFFNRLCDPRLATAVSAGTEPASNVHPEVVTVMREEGFDLSGAEPRLLTKELVEGASLLVTMGCGEKCPVVPGLKVEDWPFPDPKGRSLEDVRETRDRIREKVGELCARLRGTGRP